MNEKSLIIETTKVARTIEARVKNGVPSKWLGTSKGIELAQGFIREGQHARQLRDRIKDLKGNGGRTVEVHAHGPNGESQWVFACEDEIRTTARIRRFLGLNLKDDIKVTGLRLIFDDFKVTDIVEDAGDIATVCDFTREAKAVWAGQPPIGEVAK